MTLVEFGAIPVQTSKSLVPPHCILGDERNQILC